MSAQPDSAGTEPAPTPVQTITIEVFGANDFTVRIGDRSIDRLMWDEMLGQIAHLTHHSIGNERYPMLTAAEHEERMARWKKPADAADFTDPAISPSRS